MAIVESMNVHAVEGAVNAATVLPVGLTPTSGVLLLFAAVLSVRAFVPPRPFPQQPAAKRKSKSRSGGIGRTMQMLTGTASRPVEPAPAKPSAPQSTKLLQGAFTALLDEVYVFDPENYSVSFMNSKAEKRVKTAGLKKSRARFPDILPERNRQIVIEAARNLRRSSLDSIVFELTSDDTPLELTLKLIREDGEDEYFMAILRDMSTRVNEARAQSDYVATLSHEMRTPLTSIKGAVDLIASGKMGELSGGAAATLGVAQRNVERLLRLTNDILDLEKMDAGKMRCDFEPVSLAQLAQEAAQDILGYARQFDVVVRVESTVDQADVLGDRARLMQVMANLLSNAIKYSTPQEEVLIRLQVVGPNLRVSVVDTGPGIPENLQSDLFEPYAQGPQVQRKVASSGLGLSIAKRIVEAHSGSIGFDSVPGQGTIFYFDIPRLDETDEAAA